MSCSNSCGNTNQQCSCSSSSSQSRGGSGYVFIIVLYILMGLIGIPVFSNFISGISKIFTPSFGFIISFIFVPFIIKIFDLINIKNDKIKNIISLLITVIFIYTIGCLYLFIIKGVYEIDIDF